MLVSSETMQTLHLPYKKHNRKLSMFFPALALVILIQLASATSSCTEQEQTSLLQFIAGLSQDGGITVSWSNGTDCCMWQGITCSKDGTVTDISLPSRDIQGHISPSLGNLTGLLHLNLSNNLLSGGLPKELMFSGSIIAIDVSFNRLDGELHEFSSSNPDPQLKVLNISSNLFTGQFPPSTLGVTKNMVALNASNNSFTGQLPAYLCTSSPALAVLELSHNQFSGSIPPGLGSCLMLRMLMVGHNNLSGTLPDELFDATSLEFLSFPSNSLQGTLEGTNIVKLGNMTTLDLGYNNFDGNIPESIGHLTRLKELHLNNNKMNGELPSTLTNCKNLTTIDLNNNNFCGELSKLNFSNLLYLKTLDLMRNNFSGTIPESIYSCSNLTALRRLLASNKFHGQLTKGLGNLKSLSFLSLFNNALTNITNALHILGSSKNLTTVLIGRNFRYETMPEDDDIVSSFENLQFLGISGCPLFGKLPFWISKLTNLEILILSNNQLSGSIPAWIKGLDYVFYLDISNNSFTGKIPTALMDMPMLKPEKTEAHLEDPGVFSLPVYPAQSHQYRRPNAFPKFLDLSNNQFTSEIHLEIGQLKSLHSLNLSFNDLTGQIPQTICSLTDLQVLDLSNNNLRGAIPAALINMNFLATFDVANNDLEGPVPSGGKFNTFGISSFNGNPKLCGSMLIHKCGSAEAPPATILSTKQTDYKIAFVIAFSVFFGVGVLYDQIVLSRYFG